MKQNKVNNSINIGDKNKIKNSIIGCGCSYENAKTDTTKTKWYTKFFWLLVIPIAVIVIAATICFWIGI